jgi:hypothetical protein
VTILGSGKTFDGKDVRALLRRLVRLIGRTPASPSAAAAAMRARSHGMERGECRRDAVGLSKDAILDAQVYQKADNVRARRATGTFNSVRHSTETCCAARSPAATAPYRGAVRTDPGKPRHGKRDVVTTPPIAARSGSRESAQTLDVHTCRRRDALMSVFKRNERDFPTPVRGGSTGR